VTDHSASPHSARRHRPCWSRLVNRPAPRYRRQPPPAV